MSCVSLNPRHYLAALAVTHLAPDFRKLLIAFLMAVALIGGAKRAHAQGSQGSE